MIYFKLIIDNNQDKTFHAKSNFSEIVLVDHKLIYCFNLNTILMKQRRETDGNFLLYVVYYRINCTTVFLLF